MAKGNDSWHESLRGILSDLFDRLPGWPDARMVVIILTWTMAAGMLIMAKDNKELWGQDLYKGLLMLVVGTGFTNMILPFYFGANKSDEQKSANTANAFEAFKSQADAARTTAETASKLAGTGNGNGNGGTTQEVELEPGGKVNVEATKT